MASTVNINDMADVIMRGLTEFAELATDDMKEAVKNASTTVRKEIKANAPEDTGKYAKSWTAKKVRETSQTLTMVFTQRTGISLHTFWNMAMQKEMVAEWKGEPTSHRQNSMESGSCRKRLREH